MKEKIDSINQSFIFAQNMGQKGTAHGPTHFSVIEIIIYPEWQQKYVLKQITPAR